MTSFFGTLRTLLVLARVSNLPTVWSNLLVGWFLAGGSNFGYILYPLLLLIGGSFLYVGGMYLNDFCDAAFDKRHNPERPIPAGKISRQGAGYLTALWFAIGMACLAPFGGLTVFIGALLIVAIVLYDFQHKNFIWAPAVMGICRLLLYPLAASAKVSSGILISLTFSSYAEDPSDKTQALQSALGTIPVAVPLALYVAGIAYVTRGKNPPGRYARWAVSLLLLPAAFSFSTYANLNTPEMPLPIMPVVLICLLQLSWLIWLLVPFFRKTMPSADRVVSGLIAGIVLVDMIALVPLAGPLGIVLFPLFALTLLLQRIIPAT